MLHIYIDADACPMKSETYRVAKRYELQVTLVSNSRMKIPDEDWIKLDLVEQGADEADNRIVELIQESDIVITADILLASRCIKKKAFVLNPNGKLYTEDNIGQSVALRDLMTDLRGAGEMTGGPAALTKRDKSKFLQELDRIIQSIRRINSLIK